MAHSKIVYYGETLIDLTSDSVTEDDVASGKTFHDKSGALKTGKSTKDSDTSGATATEAEVLNGETFFARGEERTGSMPNIGKQSATTISTRDGTVQIQQGYHDGSAYVGLSSAQKALIIPGNIKHGVTILGQTGTYDGDSQEIPQANIDVTPAKTEQIITPGEGYTCLAQVTVKPVPYSVSANSAGGTTVTIGG